MVFSITACRAIWPCWRRCSNGSPSTIPRSVPRSPPACGGARRRCVSHPRAADLVGTTRCCIAVAFRPLSADLSHRAGIPAAIVADCLLAQYRAPVGGGLLHRRLRCPPGRVAVASLWPNRADHGGGCQWIVQNIDLRQCGYHAARDARALFRRARLCHEPPRCGFGGAAPDLYRHRAQCYDAGRVAERPVAISGWAGRGACPLRPAPRVRPVPASHPVGLVRR